MIQIELPRLVERLNPLCRQMLELAAARCIAQQEDEIRIEHLLYCMLDQSAGHPRPSDVHQILARADIDIAKLCELLRPGRKDAMLATGYPVFSPLLVEWLQQSWLIASTELQQTQLRSGALLLVLLLMPARYLALPLSRLLSGVDRTALRQQFIDWVAGSVEGEPDARSEAHTLAPAPAALRPMHSSSSGEVMATACMAQLAHFTRDMTQAAEAGVLDPVLCREQEIDQMIDILCRRRKNNPMVVGEAGVGKSALIEGLALRIVAGQVPDKLRNVRLLSLDLAALQAGASVKGEFEKRFKAVMQAMDEAPYPIVLFIDEAHTLIGAGNAAGGLDVANLLKPALARGALRMIAATTWREYKKYIEKDAALARRFQPVKVREPDVETATMILRGLRHTYEQAHGVLIDETALQAAARLSARYIAGRQLPDKAIDVLDTACARVAINLTAPPREVSLLHTRLQQRMQEIEQLEREQQIGLTAHTVYLADLRQAQQQDSQQLAAQTLAWQQQQQLVRQIMAYRQALLCQSMLPVTQLSGDPDTAGAKPEGWSEERARQCTDQLTARVSELDALQQSAVLVAAHVDAAQVAAVIAEWTGVPLQRITQGELEVVTHLPDYLGVAIRGQSMAIAHLHRHLLTARADLRRSGRPLGALLLVGPSGVGKTETVLQIAELLFGGRQYLTTINMSEYQEKHSVSRLIGSPPGYVGFGDGGVLSEAIRQKPYSVVLLDEVEKAHPDVLNLFYQVFDKGALADGEGRWVDCHNVLFFLTSNLGYQTIVDYADHPAGLADALYPQLVDFFKPALLARMEIVPFLPLSHQVLHDITRDKLTALAQRLQQRFGAQVTIDEAVGCEILRRAGRSENGARMLESIIDGALLPPLSLQLLQHMARGISVRQVSLWVNQGEFASCVEG